MKRKGIINEKTSGPYNSNIDAYMASKATALNAAEKWISKNEHTFDVIHLLPSFVFGRNELDKRSADMQSSTNSLLLNVALGYATKAVPMPFAFVNLHDVALAHVKAVDAKVDGDQSYILSNSGEQGESWESVFGIVERDYLMEVEAGVFKKDAEAWAAPDGACDTKKTEDAFGLQFTDFTTTVKEVLGQYLELRSAE
jgi:nucleoside-diphosphate-sugar epimerase